MKRRTDLDHLNPVPDDEGEAWAGSPEGTRSRERMLASAEVAAGAQTVASAGSRLVRYLIPAAALALVAATVVFVRDGRPVPAASGDCVVTAPTAEVFVPPDPDLADRASELGYVWYGSDELWTVLDPDGGYSERKSVWWSANFPGGATENSPEITVVARRLDHPGSIASSLYGTNAYTGEEGWFMIADFPFALPDGCWEVTGEYKGASLSFTVLVEEADSCLDVFRAVGSEQSPLEGVGLADAIPAALTAMFEVSSFTCVATQEGDAAWVRGVFVELVDQSGIGAVYAVLHDRESEAGWRGYLAENFPVLTLEFELGDKWILGVNTTHPRASEVVGALPDQDDNVSLWAAARDAFEAGSYGGR